MTEQPAKGLAELAQKLVEDAKAYARAEYAFYRALAAERAGEAGLAGGLFLAAVAVANGVIVAVLLGVMLLLDRWLGLPLAILVVLVGGFALVALLLLAGYMWARRVGRPIEPEQEG